MSLILFLKNRIKETGFGLTDLFCAFGAAFAFASSLFVLNNNFLDLLLVRQYPVFLPIVICIAGTVALSALTLFLFKSTAVQKGVLLLSCLFLCCVLAASYPKNVFFCIGLAFVLLLVIKYVVGLEQVGGPSVTERFNDKYSLIAVSVLVAVFTAAVFAVTAIKYACFYHSAFDFGIFCSMFESMVETGLPTTTFERGTEISHFAVHFSPFFYLLLPVYALWRSPLCLLFMQAFGIALGAFAVRRICRALELSPVMATGLSAVYLLFPTMANGCYYDFHENKFLSVLILWALAFILEKKRIGAAIFLLLILTVKEDAFIYVLAICLWMLVTKRDRIFALIAAAFSIGWFFFACNMIQVCGGEIMSDRFRNYSADPDGGLLSAVRTCFIDIGYLLREVFAGAASDKYSELTYSGQKLEFIWWTCIPLLFAPFLRKRSAELVLLIPVLVINLMPEWLYQFNVDFQYTYGSAALIIFSALLFIKERKAETRRFFVASMLCLSLVFTVSLVWSRGVGYFETYRLNKDKYVAMEKALEKIPEDSTVTAYGYMVPHLWRNRTIQAVPKYYGELVLTEYFVVDTRYESSTGVAEMYHYMGDDYELVSEAGFVKIFKIKD